ncbi:MAG: glycerol kinase, partial [Cyanobacteria bacterium J06650_10]
DTTALGAAYLAGLAVGSWKSQEELVRLWQMEKRFSPVMSQEKRMSLRQGWKRAIAQTLSETLPPKN